MKNTFIYRLFGHSKMASAIVVVYMLCYAITFGKKMDMMFFPYNSMFSSKDNENSKPQLVAVKVNGNPINITSHLYWKKDFLEQAPMKYALYLSQNKVSYLEHYINTKIYSPSIKKMFLKTLVPEKTLTNKWFEWYNRFAGIHFDKQNHYELAKYDFSFINGEMVMRDSTTIISSIP